MDLTIFFKNSFLNDKVSNVLSKYDKQNDGSYSREEFSIFLDQTMSSSPLTRIGLLFYSKKKVLEDAFELFDYDKNTNITLEEFNKFLNEEYSLELDSLKNKSIREAYKIINTELEKNKNKKTNSF